MQTEIRDISRNEEGRKNRTKRGSSVIGYECTPWIWHDRVSQCYFSLFLVVIRGINKNIPSSQESLSSIESQYKRKEKAHHEVN